MKKCSDCGGAGTRDVTSSMQYDPQRFITIICTACGGTGTDKEIDHEHHRHAA